MSHLVNDMTFTLELIEYTFLAEYISIPTYNENLIIIGSDAILVSIFIM